MKPTKPVCRLFARKVRKSAAVEKLDLDTKMEYWRRRIGTHCLVEHQHTLLAHSVDLHQRARVGLSVDGAAHNRDWEVESYAGAERHLASDREAVLAAHCRLVAAVSCSVVHDRRGRIDRRLSGAVE